MAYWFMVGVVLVPAQTPEEQARGTEDTVLTALDQASEALTAKPPRFREALRVLGPVEQLEPNNPWLWFYRGLAEGSLGNIHTALEVLDRAERILTELGDPEPVLAEAIETQRRRLRKRVFSLSARFGLAYDTNVTFRGADLSSFDLITGRHDGVYSTSVGLTFAPIANERESLAVDMRIGQAWHFSIGEFNYQDYGASIRYTRLLSAGEAGSIPLRGRWHFGLRYDYDFTLLGNDAFISSHVLSPSITYTWPPAPADRVGPAEPAVEPAARASSWIVPNTTSFYYQFEGRNFLTETSPELDRDGFVNAFGFEQSFILQPIPGREWFWRLGAGYKLSLVATEGTEFDRETHDFILGVDIPLGSPLIENKPLDFNFSAQWHIGDYRNNSVIDRRRRPRDDLIVAYTWVLSQKIIEDGPLGDLAIHGLISWIDANSNVRIRNRTRPFSYDKVVYGLQLAWTW